MAPWRVTVLAVAVLLVVGLMSMVGCDSSGSGASTESTSAAEVVELYPVRSATVAAYGYINKAGDVVIDATWEGARPFSEDLAAVMLAQNWGFIDETGEAVVLPQYVGVQPYSEGLAMVIEANGTIGFIDKTGEFVIEPRAIYAESFSDGLALVSENGKSGFIDRAGTMIVEPQFSAAAAFSGGLAYVQRAEGPDPKWGYIDAAGRLVWPGQD
jgi:hypothetical protein